MLRDIVAVTPLGDYRLHIRFDDGTAGDVDLGPRLRFEGVFAPLKDPAVFARVTVHPELGTLVWPGGADLDPVVLYAAVTGTKVDIGLSHTAR